MAAAIATAKELQVQAFPVDVSAIDAIQRMWSQMGLSERVRYRLSGIRDRFGGKKRISKVQKDYSSDEAGYVEAMRRKYPTMVRVLIDERNAYMAARILEICQTHKDVVAVMGDGHVDGIIPLLGGMEIRTVRLGEIMDPVKLKDAKARFWMDEP